VGICRGFHFLNVFFGGRIEFSTAAPEHVGTVHSIYLTDALIQSFFGSARTDVNSFHKNAVRNDGLAPEFRVFACTESRVIEGAKHCALPIYGVQWHPERPGPSPEANRNMIKHFLGITDRIRE
jgi:putative glutamine amidotransferase